LTVEFTLMGQPFMGLNGGPFFKFNEAVSFQIPVETQAEVNRLSDALSAVPEAEQCGWVKDRYGLSWQIVPRQLKRLLGDADPARAKRAFDAMMQMKRIDIAALERAADDAASFSLLEHPNIRLDQRTGRHRAPSCILIRLKRDSRRG
jgi:predicted 3-demethylubiquinone-9 3-methyltransferase (glyoxalase superfamily)